VRRKKGQSFHDFLEEEQQAAILEQDRTLASARVKDIGTAALGGGLEDADHDTKVQVEESADEDKIRMDTAGVQRAVLDNTALDLTVPVKTNTINEHSAAAGVTIDDTLIKDNAIYPDAGTADVSFLISGGDPYLYGDYTDKDYIRYDTAIDRWYFYIANTEIARITKGAGASGSLNVNSDIMADTINEHTDNTGVTIDTVLIKDGNVDGRDVSTDGTKLDGIEAAADVTDATNVNAAGAVMEGDFDATTFLYATDDNTPQPKTPAEVMAILSGQAGADFAMNTHKITGVVDPGADQDAATKKYVDDNLHSAVTLHADLDSNLLSLSTQELGLDSQNANLVFAGPTEGEAAIPTFRSLVAADMPDISATYVPNALFDAQSILAATNDDTPAALVLNEQEVVGRLTDGNVAGITIGIADNNMLQVDDADAADGDIAIFTANGIEGVNSINYIAYGESGIDVAAHQINFTVDDETSATITATAIILELPLYILEQAAASADVAGYGQIWVQNDDPNTLWFTDDGGTDHQLGVGGNGGGANTALSNLASVAINTSLIPATDSAIDLGSATPKYWANTYSDKVWFNATAAIDGATAGKINATGNLQLSGVMGLMGTAPDANIWLKISPTTSISNTTVGVSLVPTLTATGANIDFTAVAGLATLYIPSGGSGHDLTGLSFQAMAVNLAGDATVNVVQGIQARPSAYMVKAGATMTITEARGLYIQASTYTQQAGTLVITDHIGIKVDDVASAYVTNLYGLKIADCTTATTINRILELGPTPYLRLLGSGEWTPAASETPLFLAYDGGPTLGQVTLGVADSGGAGFRTLRVPNAA